MRVREIMTRDFEMIGPEEPVIEAAKKMRVLNVPVLPVGGDNAVIGMITDRDIVVRVAANGKKAKNVMVKDAMSPQIVSCLQDEDIEDAIKIMRIKQVARLLVFDEDNNVVGVLSLGDIAAKTDLKISNKALETVPHKGRHTY